MGILFSNLYHGGKFTIEGEFVKENTMSEDLREKLLRGGVPGPLLERFMGKEMIAFVVGNIPLLYCINKEWYNALMNTVFGKLVLGITGIVILVTWLRMNKQTKPIEYKE